MCYCVVGYLQLVHVFLKQKKFWKELFAKFKKLKNQSQKKKNPFNFGGN